MNETRKECACGEDATGMVEVKERPMRTLCTFAVMACLVPGLATMVPAEEPVETPGESKWAQPEQAGAVGTFPFLETFDEEGLDRMKWKYSITPLWPPGTSNPIWAPKGSTRPPRVPYELEGNSYVKPIKGKLVHYVNCSAYYSTIRTWPIWSRPKDDSKWYAYAWGVIIQPFNFSEWEYGVKHGKGEHEKGFIIGLAEKYDQSFFSDRESYLAIKGVQPTSAKFKPLPGHPSVNDMTKEEYTKTVLVMAELKLYGEESPDTDTDASADEYVLMGEPVDVSWDVSRDVIVARWKRSSETEWRILRGVTTAGQGHRLLDLYLQFAGSWGEYTVEAVEVCREDKVSLAPKTEPGAQTKK